MQRKKFLTITSLALSTALETDYHDYQYLVRDYKDFTKLTINGFFEGATKLPEHIFGVKET
jgi:hypothetical protein